MGYYTAFVRCYRCFHFPNETWFVYYKQGSAPILISLQRNRISPWSFLSSFVFYFSDSLLNKFEMSESHERNFISLLNFVCVWKCKKTTSTSSINDIRSCFSLYSINHSITRINRFTHFQKENQRGKSVDGVFTHILPLANFYFVWQSYRTHNGEIVLQTDEKDAYLHL